MTDLVAKHNEILKGYLADWEDKCAPWRRVGHFAVGVAAGLVVASFGYVLISHPIASSVCSGWAVACSTLAVWSHKRFFRRQRELRHRAWAAFELVAGIEPAASALPRRRSPT